VHTDREGASGQTNSPNIIFRIEHLHILGNYLVKTLQHSLSEMADKDKTSIEQHDAEEAYNSSEDGDFNPDAAEAEAPPDEDVSSSEDDDTTPQPKRAPPKKRKKPQTNVQELDSGDEATITELKRSKKLKTHGEQNEEQDSGGEGGLIKTRAQRRAEYVLASHVRRAILTHVAESKSARSIREQMSAMSLSTWTPSGPP
jgi:glucan-binding YG repeat protein